MAAATRMEIASWLRELYEPGSGPHTSATKRYSHMIVACDTFDYEDYPIFIKEGQDVRAETAEVTKDAFGRVMEVYSRNHGFDEQMAERRAYHLD